MSQEPQASREPTNTCTKRHLMDAYDLSNELFQLHKASTRVQKPAHGYSWLKITYGPCYLCHKTGMVREVGEGTIPGVPRLSSV